MKKFALLKLFPCGMFSSGNLVLDEHTCIVQAEAVQYFQTKYPQFNLDSDGYSKEGNISYCIAEFFQTINY